MLVKQKIKYIQSLGQKKFREQEGLFIAEGPKLVTDILEAGTSPVREIYAVADWISSNKMLLENTSLTEVTEQELEKISQLTTPNQVLAVVQQYAVAAPQTVKNRITLALDTIQDPGNLGTIIRIADWFGVGQIVCSHGSADIYNPKVVQSTMGSIARVKVFYTELDKWLSEQKDVRIYATVLEGQDITSMNKLREGILVFGNESKGISPEIMLLANVKITIPRKGQAESLNAAVATGIVLGCLI